VEEVTEYQSLRTNVPPVLAIENGELVVKLIFGDQTFVAGVGDGSWFFSQVVTKLVDPALRAAYPRGEFASPND
jgi:type IV secretory pathway TrbD component